MNGAHWNRKARDSCYKGKCMEYVHNHEGCIVSGNDVSKCCGIECISNKAQILLECDVPINCSVHLQMRRRQFQEMCQEQLGHFQVWKDNKLVLRRDYKKVREVTQLKNIIIESYAHLNGEEIHICI